MALVFSSNFVAERLASRDFENDEIQCRAKQKQEHARPKATASSNQPEPQPNSDGDPDKIARDYCIARRSAIASEYQAEIARAAAWVSFLAFVAASGAIAIAAWAAKGTWDTAVHAARAAEVSYVLGRPSVFVESVKTKPFLDEKTTERRFEIIVRVGNVGGSFATVSRKAIEWHLGALPLDPAYPHAVEYITGMHPTKEVDIPDDRVRIQLSDADFKKVIRGDVELWIYGFVDYEDPWDRKYSMGHCVRWSPGNPKEGLPAGFGEPGPKNYRYRKGPPTSWT